MQYLTIFILLLTTLPSYCQTREILLQIDTLERLKGMKDFDPIILEVTNQGFAKVGEQFDFFLYEDPHTCLIRIESDSSNLKVPFDDKGGYIEIANLYNLRSDTLNINRLTLYNNCNLDSVSLNMIYFIKETTLIDEEKSYFKQYTYFPKCKKAPPKEISLRINDQVYHSLILFKAEAIMYTSTGNGYKRNVFGKPKSEFTYKKVQKVWNNTAYIWVE